MRTRDPLGLEPADGDFVKYVESLQDGQADALRAANCGSVPLSKMPPPPSAVRPDDGDGVGLGDLIAALKRTVAREKAEDAAQAARASQRSTGATATSLFQSRAPQRRRSVMDEFRGKPAQAAAASPRSRRSEQPLQFIAVSLTMFGAFAAFVALQENEPQVFSYGLTACSLGLCLLVLLVSRRRAKRLESQQPAAKVPKAGR